MPLYEYELCEGECKICRGKFSLNRPVGREALDKCPLCKKPVRKLISSFNTPKVAVAATRFLERCGYRVALVDKKCCGRPMISKGMLGLAKENAAWNVDRLAGYAEKGTPIVGLEPSCLLTLRDEYPDFLRTEAAKKVAANSFLFEEFIVRQ